MVLEQARRGRGGGGGELGLEPGQSCPESVPLTTVLSCSMREVTAPWGPGVPSPPSESAPFPVTTCHRRRKHPRSQQSWGQGVTSVSVHVSLSLSVSLGVTRLSWCQHVRVMMARASVLPVMCLWPAYHCVGCACLSLCPLCHCLCFVLVSPVGLSSYPDVYYGVCVSLGLFQRVSVTGFDGSVYVSFTLGLPISVPVCHHVCSPMCHQLARCHRVCYSPSRPQVGVSGPLVPGRGPGPAHPRPPWARLGACLQCLTQVNTEIRNPRAASLTSAPCPLACPALGCTNSPPQVLPPNWRRALTHPSPTGTSLPGPPALAWPCPSVRLLLSLSLSGCLLASFCSSLSLLPLT